MTYEDIIEGLENECDLCTEAYENCADKCHISQAIEIIEKQIPKKPKDGKYAGATVCPVCDTEFGYNTGFEYCERCGQRLDWSEEE